MKPNGKFQVCGIFFFLYWCLSNESNNKRKNGNYVILNSDPFLCISSSGFDYIKVKRYMHKHFACLPYNLETPHFLFILYYIILLSILLWQCIVYVRHKQNKISPPVNSQKRWCGSTHHRRQSLILLIAHLTRLYVFKKEEDKITLNFSQYCTHETQRRINGTFRVIIEDV